MTVVLIVGSEEQLRSGVPWCKAIAAARGSRISALVVAREAKVLTELTRRRLSEALEESREKPSVREVEPETNAIMAALLSESCGTLVMVYQESSVVLQRSLFENCRSAAFWVQSSGPPPASPQRMFAAMSGGSLETTHASERLFGFAPAAVLADPFEGDDDSSGEVARRVIQQITDSADQSGDLVLIGVAETTRHDRVYATGLRLLENGNAASVALVHDGDSLKESVTSRIRDWAGGIVPPMSREQRLELAQDLEEGSQPNLEFLGLISASAMLAAFGLLQDSAAVIIGAMLIAPLMTPIVGAGLALTHANRPLFRTSLVTILYGFLAALVASMLFGLLVRLLQNALHIPVVPAVESTTEMWARCRPSPLDFCVGLVGGIAASYARTRSHLSSALAGAAIAAALVPPIATAGLQIAFGEWEGKSSAEWPVVGPLLLVSVNVLTIMVGSSFVLWARGMRADRLLPARARWAPRMVAVLVLLALAALVFELIPK